MTWRGEVHKFGLPGRAGVVRIGVGPEIPEQWLLVNTDSRLLQPTPLLRQLLARPHRSRCVLLQSDLT